MIKVSEEDLKKAVFEVWCWQYSYTDCFNNRLIDLFRKSDVSSKRRLSYAFPEIAEAIKLLDNSDDNGDELFKKYGFNKHKEEEC